MKRTYESFVFYKTWYNVLEPMSPDIQREVVVAACRLVFKGEDSVPSLSPVAQGIFSFIREQIENSKEAYERKCLVNAENGAKGGRPRKADTDPKTEKSEKTQPLLKNPKNPDGAKKADNDKDNDNDIDNDKDNEDISFFSGGADKSAEKKEKILIDLSLFYLSNGIPMAYSEAENYYNLNEALGWCKEIKRANGDVVQQRIHDKVAYGKGWKTKHEQSFAPRDGALFADALRTLDCCEKTLIDSFRGFQQGVDSVTLLMSNQKALGLFYKVLESSQSKKHDVFALIQGVFGKLNTLNYKVA